MVPRAASASARNTTRASRNWPSNESSRSVSYISANAASIARKILDVPHSSTPTPTTDRPTFAVASLSVSVTTCCPASGSTALTMSAMVTSNRPLPNVETTSINSRRIGSIETKAW